MSGGHGSPRRRKQHEEEHEEEGGSERWLVTYADMLTLLMVLFIVLFASSNIDKKKYAALHKGLASAFNEGQPASSGGTGILQGGTTVNDNTHEGTLAGNPVGPNQDAADVVAQNTQGSNAAQSNLKDESLDKIEKEIQQALHVARLPDSSVLFDKEARGLVISIVTDKVLFDTGSTKLLPGGEKILDAIAPALQTSHHSLAVEGHTDNVPYSDGSKMDNWTLSGGRADAVLHRLLFDKVPQNGLSESGYADTIPLADNATTAGRARNRRVDIVVLKAGSAAGGATTGTLPTPASNVPVPTSEPTTAPAVAPTSVPSRQPSSSAPSPVTPRPPNGGPR
jgi:chemotaxis protein MotB